MALTDGVLDYWKFDVDSASQSSETGNITLTRNGATFRSSGFINGDYDYDGLNDNMALGSNPYSSSEFANLTVNFWINADAIVASAYLADFEARLRITQRSGGGIRVTVFHTSGFTEFETTDTFSTGSPHMVTVRYDGTTWKISIDDGTPKTQTGNAADMDGFSRTAYFGSQWNNSGPWINGKMDEIGIWNRSLSDAELTELYNSGSGFTYPFVETVTDTSALFFGSGF